MAEEKVILYDLPAKDGRSWSLNPWKSRLALNFKGIPYETQWVEYPDIEPLFKSFGLPGNPPKPTQPWPYTIPTVRFPDGKVVMDSQAIIQEIEERYPEPSLHVNDPITQRVLGLTADVVFKGLYAVVLPPIPELLNESSAEYFLRTRAGLFGMSLEELAKAKGGEEAWEGAKASFAQAAAALREKEGPFFLGETVSYADFVFVGLLHFIGRVAGQESLERVFSMEKELKTLYNACSKWLKRDSY